MKLELPESIAAYYAAKNRHEIDGMLAPFAEDAIVRDEGETHNGRAAIKAWMEDTTRRYAVTVEPRTVTQTGAAYVVEGLVSGNFPGSPAILTYKFELSNDGIRALEIG